jgi:hypothetical protein
VVQEQAALLSAKHQSLKNLCCTQQQTWKFQPYRLQVQHSATLVSQSFPVRTSNTIDFPKQKPPVSFPFCHVEGFNQGLHASWLHIVIIDHHYPH